MKNNMNLTLNHPSSNISVESIIQFINELLDCLKTDKKAKVVKVTPTTQRTPLSIFSGCLKIRKSRKAFEKISMETLKGFQNLSERQQVDVEMAFFKGIKKLEKFVPAVKEDVKKHKFSINRQFFNYELDKTLKSFKSTQKLMSAHLYPDRTNDISSNPDLYQKLVDAWAVVPND